MFTERGFDTTSLREIAERIGITKAAVCYHCASKEALLRDLVDPMLTDQQTLGDALEADPPDARTTLEDYWDLCQRHRPVMRVLIRDVTVAGHADIAPRMIHWRERINAVLSGGDAPIDRVRAVVALGGLQDAAAIFEEDELAEVRGPAIDAAERALGIGS